MRLLMILTLCLTALQAFAQTDAQRVWIRARTDVTTLQAIQARAQVRAERQNARLSAIENKRGLRSADGSTQLVGFNENGFPIWYSTVNLDAARSIQTDALWDGGLLGLDLEGQNMIVGEWDNGFALSNHQEFDNRLTQMDGSTDTVFHATHVAGTMIASGVENAAKGMAPQAQLHCYDWNSDENEMAAAALSGLLVSNHSYAFITGWRRDSDTDQWRWYGDTSISATTDYGFGRYSFNVREWDEIANAAPFYLIVKAAANDRNDELPSDVDTHYVYNSLIDEWVPSTTPRDPDGPYDCIPARGNAKNVLTVGAVEDVAAYTGPGSVEMSNFSSWGPTDDGRIKPDICGNGVQVYSTSEEAIDEYRNASGTSMAGPNVAGSAILLQQHYADLNGGLFMQAATLKALMIHTADETGASTGPDYQFGWGLMNTRRAAQVISDNGVGHILQEDTLSNGETITLNVQSIGCEPLKVTVVWNDPAGNPTAPALNDTTPMLVNDLDVRVETPGGTEFFPWRLDPAFPDIAASSGDNRVDNVEQVFIATPTAGNHTITIRHKGNLTNGEQPFALLVSGLTGNLLSAGLPQQVDGCGGDTLTLNATPSGGNPPYNFRWIGQAPMNSELKTLNSGEFVFEITDQNGCTEQDTVQVQFFPQVDLGDDRAICQNTSVTLDAGNAGATFVWSTGDASQSITVADSGTYSVTVIDQNNCVATDEVTLDVTDEIPPNTVDIIGETELCEGESTVLSAPAGYTYDWNTGENTRAIVVEENGLFEVAISSSCTTVTSAPIAVQVFEQPTTPSVYWEGEELASTFAPSYQWLYEGAPIQGATSRYYTPTQSGNYTVVVTNEDGCSAESVPFSVTTLSRAALRDGQISLYPNPTRNRLHLERKTTGPWSVAVVDVSGRVVHAQTLMASDRTAELRLAELASGIYLLQLDSGGQRHHFRIVKD